MGGRGGRGNYHDQQDFNRTGATLRMHKVQDVPLAHNSVLLLLQLDATASTAGT